MKKTFKFMVLATLASLVMLSSCEENNGPQDPEALVLSTTSLKFESSGGEQTFTVLANAAWTITAPAWVTIDPTTGDGDKVNHTVTVTVGEYTETAKDRTGEIVVSLPKGKNSSIEITQAKKVSEPAEINSADDLVNYINYFAQKATSATVKEIKADIDMTGKALNPLSAFKGTIKGNGHSIKNFVFHHPIVDTLYGTFDDIKIDATCSYVLDSTSVATIAPFSGFLMGTLSKCENKMNITATDPAFGSNTYAAGLTAKIIDVAAEGCNHEIKDCKNSGNIALVFTDSTKVEAYEYHVAGLAAICVTGTVTGSSNSGEIRQQGIKGFTGHKKEVEVGGFSSKNTKCTWKDCINTGNIYNDKYGTEKARTGGAIAWQDKVDDAGIPSMNILENCTINCTVSAGAAVSSDKGAKFAIENRNDVAYSASMIVGRMNGQKGRKTILNFGISTSPVYVAGKIVCIEPGYEKEVTISQSNVQKYVCGAGSATNYSPDDKTTAVTWQVWEVSYQAN